VYDAIDILDQIQKLVAQPAIRIKTTLRYSIRHQLRQISPSGLVRNGDHKGTGYKGFLGL